METKSRYKFNYPGPELWVYKDISKSDFMKMCKMMNCYPLSRCEGGIKYLDTEGYKEIRFQKISYYDKVRKLNSGNVLAWPQITNYTHLEWKEDRSTLICKGTIIHTIFKIGYDVEPFTTKEILRWQEVFKEFSTLFSIPSSCISCDLIFNPKDLLSYTYLIKSDSRGLYKIGKAKNPEKRLLELQTGNPDTLILSNKCIGGFSLEKYLHNRYSHRNEKGEWFNLSTEDIRGIEDLFNEINSIEFVKLLNLEINVDEKILQWIKKIKKKFGPVMEKGSGNSTKEYPNCPGYSCWCYDCSMDTMEPDNIDEENYNRKKHERRAEKWAEEVKDLYGWNWIQFTPKRPSFEIEYESDESYEKYLREEYFFDDFGYKCIGKEKERKIQKLLKEKRKPNVKVIAKSISTNGDVAFECPFCWTKFSINGEPYKEAKPVIHYHGSGMSKDELDLSKNFIIYRVNHCDDNYLGGKSFFELKGSSSNFPEEECGLFVIHITENTKRILRVR